MIGDRIYARLLAARVIGNADDRLAAALKLKEGRRSIGVVTTDLDDVSYVALDEATKAADVSVVYASSMFAGSKNASTALAGEFIGILAGPSPSAVRSGLDAFRQYIGNDAYFISANNDNSVCYFSHCISRTGSYLSREANIREGAAIAYLIAPPLEAVIALDAALKAAGVSLRKFYGPPTNTNFAGALLTGEQSACRAACAEFARVVCEVAANPIDY